jgi:hypothetical protein
MQKYQLPYYRKVKPSSLRLADGSEAGGDAGKFLTQGFNLMIRDKSKHGYRVTPILCEICTLDMPADVLVGMDWIEQNIRLIDIDANFKNRKDEVLTWKDHVTLDEEVIEITTQAQYDQLIDEALHIVMISISFDEDGCYKVSVAAVDKRDLLMDNVERFTWHGKLGQDISLDLPEEYREFAEVFSMEAAKRLPEHREKFDCEIELEPSKQPPVG